MKREPIAPANLAGKLNEAVHAAINARLATLDTMLPGSVERYDVATRKAEVKPQIKRKINGKMTSLPVLVSVPVALVWGGTGSLSSLTFPIEKGNTGMLLFCGRSMENWIARGGDSEPGDPRRFDLTDGVFIPGLSPFNVTGPGRSDGAMVLQHGPIQLVFKDGKLAIGTPAAELMDLLDQLMTRLQATVVATAVGTYPLLYAGSPLGIDIAAIRALFGLIKGTL